MVNIKLLDQLMTGDVSEIVTFRFKSQAEIDYGRHVEGSQGVYRARFIRAPKALLVKDSEVFQTMFNSIWDDQFVDIDDPVPFDQYTAFRAFIRQVLEIEPLNNLSATDICASYYYAEKYQIKPFKKSLEAVIPNLRISTTVRSLREALCITRGMGLDSLVNHLDTVKIR